MSDSDMNDLIVFFMLLFACKMYVLCFFFVNTFKNATIFM